MTTKEMTPSERQWDPTSKEAGLLNQARTQLKRADNVIANFATKLTTDSWQALTNCDHVFDANGMRTVALAVIEALTEPSSKATFETLKEFVNDRIMNMVRTAERSTSMSSNMAERYMLVAWGRLYESMKWI